MVKPETGYKKAQSLYTDITQMTSRFAEIIPVLAPISTGQPGIALEAWGYP